MEKTVQQQLDKILGDFMEHEGEVARKAFMKAGRETADRLKETSPTRSGGGEYAKSWSVKSTTARAAKRNFGALKVVVYNKDRYWLTHLLEHGHVVSNQHGGMGRAQAKPHIGNAEEYGENLLLEELERNL